MNVKNFTIEDMENDILEISQKLNFNLYYPTIMDCFDYDDTVPIIEFSSNMVLMLSNISVLKEKAKMSLKIAKELCISVEEQKKRDDVIITGTENIWKENVQQYLSKSSNLTQIYTDIWEQVNGLKKQINFFNFNHFYSKCKQAKTCSVFSIFVEEQIAQGKKDDDIRVELAKTWRSPCENLHEIKLRNSMWRCESKVKSLFWAFKS